MKKRSKVQKETLNPEWDEKFEFKVHNGMRECAPKVTTHAPRALQCQDKQVGPHRRCSVGAAVGFGGQPAAAVTESTCHARPLDALPYKCYMFSI